ncbi:hypothetical protein PY365_10930 [Roseiarcaceae bacterium H3SJ34-1]|uniref:hypothetical protein n=1 Tax=Terripilifer ovatus TaxID=3032367 RepID=UPI003AB9B49E|nr:hypothetical protein [Roseiarcaceae bacterium H3SJ34-1]
MKSQDPATGLSVFNPFGLAAVLAAIGLILVVLRSPSYLVYDELAYLPGARFLVEGHGLRELILFSPFIPTGPLHSVIHALAFPLTGLEAPRVRFVNCFLLFMSWLAISKTLMMVGMQQAYLRAATIIAVPMIWVTTGMALTEIPAMTFASFAAVATAWAASLPTRQWKIWVGFGLAGICLALATLGRQLYLPAVIGFLLISVFDRRLRWPALMASIVTCALVLPLFLTWGGLVPPRTSQVAGGLSAAHGFLAVCYLGIVILILAPAYFFERWRWSIAAGIIGGLVGLAAGNLGLDIAAGISGHLSPQLANVFQRIASGAFVGAASAFTVASLVNMWARRDDSFFMLNMLMMGGLTLTAAAVAHQFSSRYVLTAFPFAIFAVQPYFRPTLFAAARLLLGAVLGYFLLNNYLSRPQESAPQEKAAMEIYVPSRSEHSAPKSVRPPAQMDFPTRDLVRDCAIVQNRSNCV